MVKRFIHLRIGLRPQRRVIELHLFERASTVIGAVVHVDDFKPFVQQRNGRQDAVAVQTIRIQIVRFEIGGGDKTHTILEQRRQQAVQDHGVRDICDMKLVKADEFVALGNARTEHIQRVYRTLQTSEFAVHLAHELVKVQAHLALEGNRVEKAVHQKAFTPPHPTVHVHTPRNIRAVDQLLERIGASCFVRSPVIRAALQGINRTQLRWVTLVAFSGQLGQISLFDSHVMDALIL
ncbi:hypothetical protein D3C71_1579420 [compost metagenome]